MVSKGNAFADLAAKQAAKSQQIANMLTKEKNEEWALTTHDIAALQEETEASERAKCEKTDYCYNAETKLWFSKEGKVVAPKALLPWLARLAHRSGYTSKWGMQKEVLRTWHAPGFAAVAAKFF